MFLEALQDCLNKNIHSILYDIILHNKFYNMKIIHFCYTFMQGSTIELSSTEGVCGPFLLNSKMKATQISFFQQKKKKGFSEFPFSSFQCSIFEFYTS